MRAHAAVRFHDNSIVSITPFLHIPALSKLWLVAYTRRNPQVARASDVRWRDFVSLNTTGRALGYLDTYEMSRPAHRASWLRLNLLLGHQILITGQNIGPPSQTVRLLLF
jgi:hypothetical protein